MASDQEKGVFSPSKSYTGVVMQQGRVLTIGTYDEVRRDPRVIAAYLGTKAAEGHA